jgi:recombinational DNA repair protein RecT
MSEVFEVSKWVDDRVQSNIAPLIADVPGMTWDKWRVAFQSAYLKDGKLGVAIAKNPNSALLALTKCAQLGLSPDPALRHFALVPFGGEVQGMVEWRGWQHLAMESGRVVDGTINAEVIYRQEEEKRDKSKPLVHPDTKRVSHEVDYFGRDDWEDKDILGAYAEAQVQDGPWVSTMMSRKQIQKRLDMGAGTAARKWFPEMCKAKVLGALLRSGKVPLSERTRRSVHTDEDGEVTTVKAVVLPVEPSAPVQLPEGPTGGKVLFDEIDKDPFPSKERMASNLEKAIVAEFERQKLTRNQQAAMIGSVAADAELGQLTEEELQFVLDKLTGKEDAET